MMVGGVATDPAWLAETVSRMAPGGLPWTFADQGPGWAVRLAGSQGQEWQAPGGAREAWAWTGSSRDLDRAREEPALAGAGPHPDPVTSLRGMFGLAWWDAARRRVSLARDRLGFRGVFFGQGRDPAGNPAWLFASRLGALLDAGCVPRRLDPEGLSHALWNGFVPTPCTLVQGIRALPPGCRVELGAELGADPPSTRRYWQVPDHRPLEDGPARLREALTDAVARHAAGDGVALALSGGIDSSAVVALAQAGRPGPWDTVQLSFPGAEVDETPYATAVARALGTRHRVIPVQSRDLEDCWEDFLEGLDQPTFDGVNTFLLCRRIREAGYRVLVGGSGGDDVFGGNRTATALPRLQRWSRRAGLLPGPWPRWLAAVLERRARQPDRTGRRKRLAKLPAIAEARGDLVQLYQVLYSLFSPGARDRLLARPTPSAVGLPEGRLRELRQEVQADPVLYAISRLELNLFVGERMLRDLGDVSHASGVEIRAPLIDEAVIDAFGAVETGALYQPVGHKQFLRDAALARLDPALFERPKAGFLLPLEQWMRGPLQPRLEETFRDAEGCRQGGLDPAEVWRLWREFLEHPGSLYWSRLWFLWVFLQWRRRRGLSVAGG